MEWIARYWMEALFGIILTGLSVAYRVLAKKFKEEISEQKAQREGLKSLLRDRIIQSYNHYMELKRIPIYARENVESMYNAYHSLGGNGTVTNLVETLKALPTKNE